jgi:hypothetical protein
MHVRWDQDAAATPHGQLVFFAEFLAATGVFERWVSSCPLEYRSGNAPDKRDVLGTLMMGMLAGHRRYAHITALRGDAVAAQALGMNKVVSEDALRRALERIDEAASTAWMRPALMHSVREALDKPWVLDIDATIKPLYGRQEGAEIGYNPSKPKRPSHVLHTFWVGNLRLVLDVQVSSGKQHTSVHAKAALGRLLDELGDKRPALVRGDSGYGNEGILLELEQPRPALPAAPAPDGQRAAPGGPAVRAPGLEPTGQPGLPDGRRPVATARLEQEAPGGHRAPAHPGGIARETAHRRQAAAARSGRPQRARGRSAVGVRGDGHRRGLPHRGHRATLPGPCRLRERL